MVNAFVDSSVLLRWIFRAPDQFEPTADLETFTASALLRVECLRAIDRTRITGGLTAEAAAEHIVALHSHIRKWTLLPLTDDILDLAATPMPVAVATLDAVHIASAMHLNRILRPAPLVFVTHDRTQSIAARAMGLEVRGA